MQLFMRYVGESALISHICHLYAVWINETAVLVTIFEYIIFALIEYNTLRDVVLDFIDELVEYLITLLLFFL